MGWDMKKMSFLLIYLFKDLIHELALGPYYEVPVEYLGTWAL
jgi:hypothetical protein